ncbi:uncharacterized protein LOC143295095 [Babylonia areolata]|uniref:uncharacterized protein LOC143295095 n=1 Tax=Babylonia areolata TaxID=304850 RepID=UPI003FD267EF
MSVPLPAVPKRLRVPVPAVPRGPRGGHCRLTTLPYDSLRLRFRPCPVLDTQVSPLYGWVPLVRSSLPPAVSSRQDGRRGEVQGEAATPHPLNCAGQVEVTQRERDQRCHGHQKQKGLDLHDNDTRLLSTRKGPQENQAVTDTLRSTSHRTLAPKSVTITTTIRSTTTTSTRLPCVPGVDAKGSWGTGDGAVTSGAVQPSGAVSSGAVPPDGAVTSGSAAVPPCGAVTSGAVQPSGAVSSGSAAVPPSGAVPSGAVPPGGAITSGAVPPGGAATSGAVPPSGAVTSGAVPPCGAVTSGAVPPGGGVTSGAVPPGGGVTSGSGSGAVPPGGGVAGSRSAVPVVGDCAGSSPSVGTAAFRTGRDGESCYSDPVACVTGDSCYSDSMVCFTRESCYRPCGVCYRGVLLQ